MEDEELLLALHLGSLGFHEIKYWLKHLKKKKITSMKSLEAHTGDRNIVSSLAKHTKSDSDHMALFVLFKVNYSVQIQDHQASKIANESKETLDTLSFVPEYIGGRLLQGLLLTKKIQEQLKIRSDLLSWPTDIPLIRELPLNTVIKVFSSKFEEDNLKWQ